MHSLSFWAFQISEGFSEKKWDEILEGGIFLLRKRHILEEENIF